jgi:diacylglycerol kinase family enzyme
MRVTLGTLAEHHARFEPQLELEGMGRAAFALVANCTPYTYAGAKALDLVPGASFDEGLSVLAPVELRGRDLPRLVMHALRGHGLERRGAIHAVDLDRLVIRCDRPLPLQIDGEDTGDVTKVVYEAERDAVTVLV